MHWPEELGKVDYYVADFDELELTARDEAQAVFDALERVVEEGQTYEMAAREAFPEGLEITAYRRMAVPLAYIQCRAQAFVEGVAQDLDEHLTEDYGSPDPSYPSVLDGLTEDLTRAVTADIIRVLRDAPVWVCEPIAQRRWSFEELLSFAREVDVEEGPEK